MREPQGRPHDPRSLEVLVLQHASCEPPGSYEDVLVERGATIHRVEVDEGTPLPSDPRRFGAIVAMGGPMGVGERDSLGWLPSEIAFLSMAAAADVPIWGVCLGAQLLAAALGAEVATGPDPEVGVSPVRLTAEGSRDIVFQGLPQRFEALHWHGDTYSLPAGAVRLAASDAYEEQAFRSGRSYGVQFHLEATPQLVADWAALPMPKP